MGRTEQSMKVEYHDLAVGMMMMVEDAKSTNQS